jgi:tetratricopeptide (TPR) repeat protein
MNVGPCGMILAALGFVLGAGSVGWCEETNAAPALEEVALPNVQRMALDPEMESLIRAESLMKAGARVEALTLLREVLKRDVHHARALTMVAIILTELGRQRDALQLFKQLSEQNAQDYVVLNNLAWLLATASEPTLRDPAQALVWARQALLLAPDNYSVWSTLAEAYYRNGRYDRSLRAAEVALRLATEQKADGPQLSTYADQVRKSRDAVTAFSLVDP